MHGRAEALDFLFCRGKYRDRDTFLRPKVILLDLKLPTVDGLAVLREIRNSDLTRLVPVVVLTSSREQRDIVESCKLGVNSYIVKPVEFEKFVEVVKNLVWYWLPLNQTPH